MKEKLAEKDIPKSVTVDDQLALMEKSHQMAAKYLPRGTNSAEAQPVKSADTTTISSTQKEHFVAFTPTRKNNVSALFYEPTDSAFSAGWSETRRTHYLMMLLVSRFFIF